MFFRAQKTLAWNAFSFAETLLTQPVMVAIGQKVGAFGTYRDGVEVYGRATSSVDRRLVSLEDWSHYDLYDKPEPVSKALDGLVPFFKKYPVEGGTHRSAQRRLPLENERPIT